MKLSPEDKKKIYEEEKARLEAEKKAGAGKETGSNTSLKPNVAGTLCYLGAWISGIVFLIIERDNKTVRFHAMQSLFTFGILSIIIAIADSVRDWVAWFGPVWARPYYPGLVAANVVFGVFIAISVVLWLVLMYQTYHGRLIKLAFFGDIAEKLLCKLDNIREKDLSLKTEFAKTAPPPPPPPPAKEAKIPKTGLDVHLGGTRYSRIAHSVAAIVWSAIFLVFFNFFSRYFAVYSREAVDGVTWWHVYSLLTPELSLVLPI